LNISDSDNAQDLDLARETAIFFRVKDSRAAEIISEVVAAVRTWPSVAAAQGIERAEQEEMARAFRIAEAPSNW
jgi:serine/threonine-protein kinase HipA